MHIGLCNDDFYPIIQIRTKGMSYDDKAAYRKKCGFPRTIDEWIDNEKTRTNAPTANPHKRGPYLDYPLWQDDVECILNVIHKENSSEFTLMLRVRVPPTTNYLMHYWQSPGVVIDKYEGDLRDKHAPDWLKTVQTERRFWQCRTLMLEMMLYFVRNIPHNSRVSRRVSSWCGAMSPRASDLSTKESQKLRRTLNEGSPLRKKT
ncbi:hypothetical protein BDN70DRAFT_896939 [Pholiota conissans]|uniref:Uncharacterized protein n=1 Tax=Pholiota conissans TaxID=109636 RepID=A0A9P6CS56_9AGAR|nr:hypothetical protein BDN70DRAFT_896939 [Pholiota conissans]